MITVAHISDLHALSLKGVSPLSFLSHKRLGGAANLLLKRRNKHPLSILRSLIDDLNRERPDQVVVTGDLVNLSLDAEFRAARGELDRLSLGPANVSVVPGNHDIYVWMSERARSFQRFLGPFCTSDGVGDGAIDSTTTTTATTTAFPFVRLRGEVAIIGLSTARPSPVPFADGKLGPAQLAALEKVLLHHADRFRLVLLHHPPVDNRHAFLRGLRDRGALQAVLARAGAELVLHGHEHRDVHATVPGPAGPIPVIGVGSSTYDDPRAERRARYNLIRIEGKRFTVETRVHDPGEDRFLAAA